MKMKKWRLLCAGLAAAGVFMVGMPGEPMPVAEAMYSSVDASHHWYKTPSQQQKVFMLAISKGDYATVADLIHEGLDVNGVYTSTVGDVMGSGATPLYIAMYHNQRDIMQLLLENGADPNGFYIFSGGYYPYAVYAVSGRCNLELLQYLHNWGADLNAACTIGYMEGSAIDFLASNRNMNHYFSDGITRDDMDTLTYLLDEGVNPDGAGMGDKTPFIWSVEHRAYFYIDTLASYGANVFAKNKYGKNAMEIALDMNDLEFYKHVKELMERGNQPSNYTPPAGASISGSAAQAKVDRGTSLGKYAELYKKYSDASNQIYDKLEAALADTSSGVTKEKLSKEKDAIKQLKKLNEKMAKEDPLKGFKGYSVGEREKFTDLFDGLTEYNDAMIALLEYVVAHPTDGDHDQLVNLTAQVIKVQGDQKDRAAAVQEILQKK